MVRPKANKRMMKHNDGDLNQIAKNRAGTRTPMVDPEATAAFESGWDYYRKHNPQVKR